MEKTMLSISYEFLKEKGEATFNQLWTEIAKELKSKWKKQTPKKLMSDIEMDKKAEFYTLLTITGKYVRISNKKFGLAEDFTFEEVSKMRISPDEEL